MPGETLWLCVPESASHQAFTLQFHDALPGTDAGTFTATSSDYQRILLRHPNGVGDRTPDMADGIGADSLQFTVGLELDLENDWYLKGDGRHLSDTSHFRGRVPDRL